MSRLKDEVYEVIQTAINDSIRINQTPNNLLSAYDHYLSKISDMEIEYKNIFDFSFDADKKVGTWSIKPEDLTTYSRSISALSQTTFSYEYKNLVKTRHDLVAEYFTNTFGTDCEWKTLDPSIKLVTTPDLIHQINPDTWLVLEVGTTKSCGSGPRGDYKTKFTKYISTIDDFCKKNPKVTVLFWIVIVTPNEVLSSFPISTRLTDELITRFRIGVLMEDEMKRHGIDIRDMKQDSTQTRVVKGSIAGLKSEPMTGVDQTINDDSGKAFRRWVPNTAFVSKSIETMVREAQQLRKPREQVQENMHLAFMEVEETFKKFNNTRSDAKAPIQMPLFIPYETTPETADFQDVHVTAAPGLPEVVDKVWRRACNSGLCNSDRFPRGNHDNMMNQALAGGVPESDDFTRRKWHRVEVELSADEEIILSQDGYHGKKFKGEGFHTARRQEQQRGFSPNTETEDIRRFLTSELVLHSKENSSFSVIKPLLEEANNLASNKNDGLELVGKLFNLKITQALCALSSIASELALSIKQHVGKNEWIHKNVKGKAIELLVSPTNSESHIFFFIRFKGELLEEGTFRRVYIHDGWHYTDLLSINCSRLENFIKAPVLFVNSLIHFRVNVDRADKENLDLTTQSGHSEELALLTTLISLEDKSSTEEMALNVRYMIMQFSKGDDHLSWPDVGPVVKKIPSLLRSRLAVYLYKRIKEYCYMQWSNLPKKMKTKVSELDHSADQYSDLLCPFTHKSQNTFQDVVQSMYIAYSKNKNSQSEENCDFGMIKKIADHVLNADPAKEPIYRGESDPDPSKLPGPHEFSPSLLTEACNLLTKRMSNQMGRHWQKSLEEEIIRELLIATHHESLATMKASANFTLEDAKIMDQIADMEERQFQGLNSEQTKVANILLEVHRSGDYVKLSPDQWKSIHGLISASGLRDKGKLGKGRRNRVVKSCKCHEAVVNELNMDADEHPLLLSNLSALYKAVLSTTNGICCYLFKKNQHGGLREIYVLTFKSRLLQLLPETAARTICKSCPEEILTHPSRDTAGYEEHNNNVLSKTHGGRSADILHRTSSEDKSKWSQGMNVAAFSFIFSKLLGPTLSEAINRILHLFRNKRVLVPEGVMNMFLHDVDLKDETYTKLKKIFWSENKSDLFDDLGGRTFFKTPTGMWQGILHYCSSLLHVLQTIHYKSLCRTLVNGVNDVRKQMGKDPLLLVIDTVVSSDDSATYGTIMAPAGSNFDELAEADQLLDLILKLGTTHSAFFMMVESPKSTISSKGPTEFKSIFISQSTYISPSIKKVLASCTIPENEDLESRQMALANMYKDILEEGCSHYQVHLHWLVGGFLHYCGFGLLVHRLFEDWVNQIITFPDPHLGFYLVDNANLSGILGFPFVKYNSLRMTNVPIVPTGLNLIQTDLTGRITTGVLLTHGDRKRWLSFKKKVVKPGWETILHEKPKILYLDRGLTREEIETRLSSKACSKGVHESLKADVSLAKVIASTAYVLDRRSITVKSMDLTADSEEKGYDMNKTCLIHLTNESLVKETDISHATMTLVQKSVMYPNYQLYDAAIQTSALMDQCREVRTFRHRKVKNALEVRSGASLGVLPIMEVLKWKWFGLIHKSSMTTLEYSWLHYTQAMPWILGDCNATLANSPFETHIEMYSFFRSLNSKRVNVHILSRRLKSSSTIDQIEELLKYNWYPQILRVTRPESEKEDPHDSIVARGQLKRASQVNSLLSAICTAPVSGNITELIRQTVECIPITDADLALRQKADKTMRAIVMYAAAMDKPTVMIESLLMKLSTGCIKHYIEPQRISEDKKWVGPGRMMLKTQRVRCEILIHDQSVIAMKTSKVDDLIKDWKVIHAHITSDGFDFNPQNQIREYEKYFPELQESSITNLGLSNSGPINMPNQYKKIGAFSTGALITMKQKLLDSYYPVVIYEPALMEVPLIGDLEVHRERNLNGPYLCLKLISDHISDRGNQYKRTMNLLKFYCPLRLRPSDNLSVLLDENEVDSESLLQCWIYNLPMSDEAAWDLVKFGAQPCQVNERIKQIIDGCDIEQIRWFLKTSMKWRLIGQSKLKLNRFRFSDDIPKYDGNQVHVDIQLEEKTAEIMKFLGYGAEDREDIEEAGPSVTWGDEPLNWADDSVPERMELISEIKEPEEPASIRSSYETEEINPLYAELEVTPGLFMSHSFWDDLIKKLNRFKVWESIENNVPLTEVLMKAKLVMMEFLSIPEDNVTQTIQEEADDFFSGD